eukprot:EG_transcript_68722
MQLSTTWRQALMDPPLHPADVPVAVCANVCRLHSVLCVMLHSQVDVDQYHVCCVQGVAERTPREEGPAQRLESLGWLKKLQQKSVLEGHLGSLETPWSSPHSP